MKVKDIMTTNVACVNPSTTIVEAAQLMKEHNVGSIPVCDKNSVVGIITDRDIVVRNIAKGKNSQETSVKDTMTPGVTTVTPEMDVNEVAKMMAHSQIRRVPVVEDNKLVGIVALGDIAIEAKYNTEVADTLTEISLPSNLQKL